MKEKYFIPDRHLWWTVLGLNQVVLVFNVTKSFRGPKQSVYYIPQKPAFTNNLVGLKTIVETK